jgi:DNA-binding NarL/FixJ family response regulator
VVGEAGGLSDVVYEIAQADDLEQFRMVVISGVRQVVGADLSSYTEVNIARKQAIAPVDPPIDVSQPEAALGRLAEQHPLVTRSVAHAQTISDYLSVRAYHALELYAEVYRPIDAEDQLAINLDAPDGTAIGVALNRPRRSFTHRDRERLDQLRGPIVRGYRRVQARERAIALLECLADDRAEPAVGVIGLSRDGEPAFISDRARGWLRSYFPDQLKAPLPEALAEWICAQPPSQPAQLTVSGEAGWLQADLLVETSASPRLVELRERPRQPATRLTGRQREILELVAAGQTNQSIAHSLKLSRRTVENHLQTIYRRLGVSNRTAAAAALSQQQSKTRTQQEK